MEISFARHQFPPDIIRHAVWLYLRFTLSFGDVVDLLAERGLDVSYETIRRWVLKFRAVIRQGTSPPTSSAHLAVMEWMPPPDGIAMCQGGDVCRIPPNREGIHERS
jgi:putative transposase